MHRLLEWWIDRNKVTEDEMKRLQANEKLSALNTIIDSDMPRSERVRYIGQWWGKAKFELGRMRGSTRR